MNIFKVFIINILLVFSLNLTAKDYKASLFGVISDGVTLNTGSIQYAIDYISANGGGRLVFYVGRYLTGSFHLKSNVTIQLEEGAVLVAFYSIYDYLSLNGTKALIVAANLKNIGITGKGVIDGQGEVVLNNIREQIQKGYLEETESKARPALINFDRCSNTTIDGVILRNACGDIQLYSGCNNVLISNITIESDLLPDTKGVVFSNCDGFVFRDSYIKTSGTELSSSGTSKNVSVAGTINSNGKKIKATK